MNQTQLNDLFDSVVSSIKSHPESLPFCSVYTTDDVVLLLKDIQKTINEEIEWKERWS